MQERFDRDPALSNISILGVDPGGMMTQLLRRKTFWYSHPIVQAVLTTPLTYVSSFLNSNPMMRFPSKSARDVMRAALGSAPPLSAHPKGLYFNGDALALQSAEARDPVKTGTVWRDSVKLTGLVEDDTVLKAWN